MNDFYLISTLALMNVIQFLFWGFFTQTLLNKLMSKDFAEYNLIKNGPRAIVESPSEENEFEEQEILNELNGMLPKGAS